MAKDAKTIREELARPFDCTAARFIESDKPPLMGSMSESSAPSHFVMKPLPSK